MSRPNRFTPPPFTVPIDTDSPRQRSNTRMERILNQLRPALLTLENISKGSIVIDFAGDHYSLKITEFIDGE